MASVVCALDRSTTSHFPIRSFDDKIEMVNQFLLPHTTEWLLTNSIVQAHNMIKMMRAHLQMDTITLCKERTKFIMAIELIREIEYSTQRTGSMAIIPPPMQCTG